MISISLICNRNNLSSETLNELAIKMKDATYPRTDATYLETNELHHLQDIIAAAADRMRELEDDNESYKTTAYSREAKSVFKKAVELTEPASSAPWTWKMLKEKAGGANVAYVLNCHGHKIMTYVFEEDARLMCYVVNNLIPALETGLE